MHTSAPPLAPVCILACSPRAGGNSDHMAELFAKGVRQGGKELNLQAHIYALREYHILPCTACNACFAHPQGQCQLSARDDVAELFGHMAKASHIFLAAPIFFYHVPAMAKAFMDRAQQFWAQRMCHNTYGATHKHVAPQNRPQHNNHQHTSLSILQKGRPPLQNNVSVGLVAARTKGDNLFAGTLWSLRYFFDLFDKEVGQQHLFMGHDGPSDFAKDAAACAHIEAAGYAVGTAMSNEKPLSS